MIGRAFQGTVVMTGSTSVDIPVQVELIYDYDRNPLAVTMTLAPEGEAVVAWVFSRDLLFQGINSSEVSGEGDIRFRCTGKDWPRSGVTVCLRNITGHADIRLPHYDLMAFLAETESWSRQAEESIEKRIDSEIKEILG